MVRIVCYSPTALQIVTMGVVYDIILVMRKCRTNLPIRCYHLISRAAHRAFFLDGADEEGACRKTIPDHPVSPMQEYDLL